MNPDSTIIFLGMIAAVCVVVWGLFSQRRSMLLAGIAVCVAVLAAIGAWYAWAETQSVPWTVGYGVLAVASIIAAIRQFASRGRSGQPGS